MLLQTNADVIQEVDVLVCGGGPAGVGAAVAAARAGAKTLLAEAQGCLGGVATSGLVGSWLGGMSRDGTGRPVVGGVFAELVARVSSEVPPVPAVGRFANLDFEACKRACDDLVLDAGAQILLLTSVLRPVVEGGKVSGVFVANKDGVGFIRAGRTVDCTGDADVAARAGVQIEKGRPEWMEYPGEMAPATLRCLLKDVDRQAMAEYVSATGDKRFRDIVGRMKDNGEWPDNFAFDMLCMDPFHDSIGLFQPNILRQIQIDGTDARSITDGMIRGRKENWQLLEIMRKHAPGCADARMVHTAPMIGIRETRRIIGEYVLRQDDVSEGKRFHDTIALTGYGWDHPHPRKPSYQEMFRSWRPTEHSVIPHPYTEIPYRCLLPRERDGLIVAGRSISVEWHVQGPIRVMAPCMATGQAAGTAAALSVRQGRPMRSLDTDELWKTLRTQGTILELSEAGGGACPTP